MKFPKLSPYETVFGFTYFMLQLVLIPEVLVTINKMLQVPISDVILNVIFFALNFLMVLILFHKFLRKNLRVLRTDLWFVLRCAGMGLLIYIMGSGIFSVLVTILFPAFYNINDAAIMKMVQEYYGLMNLGTVIFVPLAEECFYRGLIFRNFNDKYPILAYILSIVLFSLVHVLGYINQADIVTLVLCFIQYLPAGFALAWCYQHSGCIYAPILVHMVVNQTGMLLMR